MEAGFSADHSRPAFYCQDDAFGFAVAALQQEPARALGNEAAQEEDRDAERGADAEGGAPARVRRQEAR